MEDYKSTWTEHQAGKWTANSPFNNAKKLYRFLTFPSRNTLEHIPEILDHPFDFVLQKPKKQITSVNKSYMHGKMQKKTMVTDTQETAVSNPEI